MGIGARPEFPVRRSAKCPLWVTFGLLALAAAVTLWGFSYKISLYTESSDPLPQVPVAKIWIEHRYGYAAEFRFVADDDKGSSHLHHLPLPVLSSDRLPDCSSREALVALPTDACGTAFLHSTIPLRSPPFVA